MRGRHIACGGGFHRRFAVFAESCKIKWPKKMTHREISDIMLSEQTKHEKRFQNESLTV